MTQDEIIAMAKEAWLPVSQYADDQKAMQRFAALVAEKAAAKEREAIADEWHQRIGSDLEHGVRWVNARESARFKEVYPQAAGFAAWLSARGQKEGV